MTAKGGRSRTFFRVRVAVLLAILLVVVLWAWRDVRMRRERNHWDRTLRVAIIVLGLSPVDEATMAALRERTGALEDAFADEMHRYRPGAQRPFAFTVFGPALVTERPPTPASDGVVDLAKQSYAQWRYLSAVDDTTGLDTGLFDARIYALVRAPTRKGRSVVEGQSEENGRVGTVEVEIDPNSADFALFVVGHELLHTLGATDKYDASGRVLVPAGLADPSRSPLYPQERVEIMARNRPVAPGDERPPDGLAELTVGQVTAREIGWTP
jgi:hypothetical protein